MRQLLVGQRVWVLDDGEMRPAVVLSVGRESLTARCDDGAYADLFFRRGPAGFQKATGVGVGKGPWKDLYLVTERVLVTPGDVRVGTPASIEVITATYVKLSVPASVVDFEYDPIADRLLKVSLAREDIGGGKDGGAQDCYHYDFIEDLLACGACGDPRSGRIEHEDGTVERVHLSFFDEKDRSKESKWPPCKQCKGNGYVPAGTYHWKQTVPLKIVKDAVSLSGARERVHQPLHDSVVAGVGISTVQNVALFGESRPQLGERRAWPGEVGPGKVIKS